MRRERREMSAQTWLWLAVAMTVLLADQFTKLWIITYFDYGTSEAVTAFFNVVHVHNYGAAFSIFNHEGGWQRWVFSLFALVVSIVILVWIARLPSEKKLEGLALSLILGGAVGNLYDRVTLGYVVDFLDFHWSGVHFPAFNVADAGISVGAVLMILEGFLNNRSSDQHVDKKVDTDL